MVSWMYNNAKDAKTEIDNTLCAFVPFSLNWKTITQRRDGAKNKSLLVYFTGIFDCASRIYAKSDIPQVAIHFPQVLMIAVLNI
ncbi:MAG: hypothetical protein U9N46_06495 [Euryarchaeota archaeon]|nr:MAG: hypothetical protein C5S47_08300 [ANME-2 cluster archaeon]MEA1864830.1 hypothetical protein [Euryarchaeota archaeon]